MSFHASTDCGLTSIENLTEELRVSLSTVYRWQRRGWLQGVMVGRRRYFTREQLKRFEQRASMRWTPKIGPGVKL
ncbi:MAG: helix-turn-helix domain-containing protein [Verrucomicrobiae bacterium]|jgi:excisionase family DNA binding protein|nr:helix-turn-helix domain-containing protein [Verrucomicrobiae bacterium]